MKKLLGGFVIALSILVITPHASASLGPTDPSGQYVDPDAYLGKIGWRPVVFMVGDSITWRTYPRIHSKVRWEVSAYPGRQIGELANLLADRRASRSPLNKVVIALGTNATPGYHIGNLRRDLRVLPKRTKVILVTPYRDPEWDSRAARAYSWAMRQIARHRPHTCVVEWARYVRNHRGLLMDGIHPAGHGKTVWSRMVFRAVRSCR